MRDKHPMERKVVIVLSRCSRSKAAFGMRIERRPNSVWATTWAFAIKESAAKREGYDKSKIGGSFTTDPDYPGCPHCRAGNFYLCGSCSRVACWDGESHTVTCPWCDRSGQLSGEISSLEAGSDQ